MTLTLSWRSVLSACALLALAVVVLWIVASIFDSEVARACYLTIMLLVSAARAQRLKTSVVTGIWAVLVAIGGFLAGGYGVWATLVGLVVLCACQGFLRVGDGVSIARSPVNFVVFAGLSNTDMTLAQASLGALIGAVFLLSLARLAHLVQEPTTQVGLPVLIRLIDSLSVACGAIAIVLLSRWLNFDYMNWALLSFCMIVAVSAEDRMGRVRERLLGTVIGAMAGTLVAFLPAPLPTLAAVVCLILCIAYQLAGKYAMFVSFLTPAVLLLSQSEVSTLARGAGRVEAVLASVVIALGCTWLAQRSMSDRRVS